MKSRLDELVLEIEFLLISVVQGVALASLATSATAPIIALQYQYWPYIAIGLIIILIFWSQAIVHSISFINWPLSLFHNFLYFLAAFVEVIAFSQLTNPPGWFLANAAFFGVAFVLYAADLQIIKSRASTLNNELLDHARQEQRFGLWVLVPFGLVYNLVAWWVVSRINPQLHLTFGLIQLIAGVIVLLDSMRRFQNRAALLTVN